MAYTLYTSRNHSQQQETMWDLVTFQSHVEMIQRRSILPLFRKYCKPGDRILEAGCGIGGWVYYLNQQGYRTFGVDNNFKIIERNGHIHLPIAENDVLNLSFRDKTFDAYLSLGVVEHFIQGPQAALYEARRVLKDRGLILLSTPCTNAFRALTNHRFRDLLNLYKRLKGQKLHFVEYRFTRSELIEHVKSAGFEVLETVPNDTRLDQHNYAIGFYTDWPFFRDKREKWKLSPVGKFCFRLLKSISPYLVVSGILVVGRKLP